MEVLPVALKKKEPEFPQLLELRTRKNFYSIKGAKKEATNQEGDQAGTSNNPETGMNLHSEGQTYNESPDEVTTDPFKPVYDELMGAYNFLSENKYVIEAIFENVLLENNLYKFPLSSISDTEKKQLMEKLLSNEEFKEYAYQKILRVQELGLDKSQEGLKNDHQLSQAATQADARNSSMVNSSIMNSKETRK